MPQDFSVEARIAFLRWLIQVDQTRRNGYGMYRAYYDGEHQTQLTARMRRFLQINVGEEFRDNYCGIVVDALCERLTVAGFGAAEQDAILADWWEKNRMDGKQGIVHTSAVRDGDAYLVVGYDQDRAIPTFEPEMAYDGTEGVEIRYKDERRTEPAYAMKYWRIEREAEEAGYVRRLNLYYPNRIEKYLSDERVAGGDWVPYTGESPGANGVGEGDGAMVALWPEPWTRDGTLEGEPLGIPVIPFRNQDRGYSYGRSELADVIPLQNALNKTLIDLVGAADQTGFPLYYLFGADGTGVTIAPGALIHHEEPNVTFGKVEPSNLAGLDQLKDSIALEIARVTQTPASRFQISGHVPSDQTLKTQDMGLVAKAENRQVFFGNSWEDALALARRLHNTFGAEPEMDETVLIATRWKPAQVESEREQADTIRVKQEIGISESQALRELGYTDDQIAEMQREVAAKRATFAQALIDLERQDAERAEAARPYAFATRGADEDEEVDAM